MIKVLTSIRYHTLLTTMMICMVTGIPQSFADFDPVNDDTDIFLANPGVVAQRPNVLLYIDNTANWNTAFANEKSALVSVVSNLSEQFNLGMMLFPETGGGNDNVDGATLRFAIRQMTTANKAVLSSLVNAFDVNADKSNNSTLSEGMVEVFRYFSAGDSYSSYGKAKADYAGNSTHEATIAGLGEHALPTSPTSSSNFTSPIAAACQKNFVIYLSNGPANENNSSLTKAETELAATGYDTSSTISLSPDGQEGSWADEWAQYMSSADINATGGNQNITFYTVEVDPGSQSSDLAMTALMKSVALHGDGEYFDVSSANGGQAIVNTLNTIFTEIQAVNSVFASTTLPVSVNVRGTNLNQVYIGVFRPDESKSPRWFGNLKMYKLGFDGATSTLFLADATPADADGNLSQAENPTTGFINSSSPSFWTSGSSFWNYRTVDENGVGGNSDFPDGDLVEKGGAAQQVRAAYPTSQETRKLYTCTGACVAGSTLSDYLFHTTNSDITNASLGLGTVAISTLTGKETQAISAVTDVKAVSSATTATGGQTVTQIISAAVGKVITTLTSQKTTTITAMDNTGGTLAFASLDRSSVGGACKNPAVATTTTAHGLSVSTMVHISGVSSNSYNGSFPVASENGGNGFTYNGNCNLVNGPTFGSAEIKITGPIVEITAANHELDSGDSITLAGVLPGTFNGDYTVSSVASTDIFRINTGISLTPVTDVSSATVTSASTNATATSTSHGFTVGNSILIAGSDESGYNGTFTVTREATNDFSFTIPVSQPDDTDGATAYAGTATATATTALVHGFINGATVSITGADPSTLNGSFNISNVTANTFDYIAPGSIDDTDGGITASAGTSNIATVTIPNHNYNFADVIVVSGITPTEYNGTQTITSVIDANTIQYTVTGTPGPSTDVSTAKARLNSPTAFVTLTAHGYASTNTITIEGATPTGFNKANTAISVIDNNTFKYTISASQNATATGTITSTINTTLAKARAVNHGFSGGTSVAIAGSTPTAFNGNFIITKIDNDNFTYTLPSAQGDAAGTLTASAGSGSSGERSNIINWVRGADNQEDEDGDGSTTDIRASIHSDVLHSRPAVVNYNRHGNDDDVYVYYGGNDGIFRAVKGGFAQSDAAEASPTEPLPGQETWGFIPQEFFSSFERLRNNEPTISSSNKKPYFADGTIGVLAEDNSGPGGANVPDGKIDITVDDNTNPDKVHIFITMRRGGRFIYALDVSDPSVPKLLWKKSYTDTGFGELGYTWSAPNVVTTAANSGNPILLFGAGYDPSVEDVDPATITARDAVAGTVTAGGTFTRTMGRGIFALDAATGAIIWQAGPSSVTPTGGHPYVAVSGMNFAIPSDVVAITDRAGSVDNRAYVGDTGGNMWRIDMANSDPALWKVTNLASIADESGLGLGPPDPSGLRKFLFPPDVVYGTGTEIYDAILIGSGDREHPFDDVVQNRFYMFKDVGIEADTPLIDTIYDRASGPITVSPANDATLIESDLFDATDNCIQAPAGCGATGQTDSAEAVTTLASKNGWYITLQVGEKVTGNSVTLNNVTFFNTNIPESELAATDCSSGLGEARQYKVGFDNATAFEDQNGNGSTDTSDRFTVHDGGGYLPSPVPVVVEIDGEIHEGVISGVAVDDPPGSELNARLRKFWYKDID